MKERIEAWRQAYELDDNAIVRSLVTFSWNLAAYMSVARMVEAAPDADEGGKQLNNLMLDLLHRSYWGGAVLATRRLLDRGGLHGTKGVCSLRALIADVKSCRCQITRRVYVEDIAGVEYDYEGVEQRAFEYLRARSSEGPVWMPPELDSYTIRIRHEQFDFLSGVGKAERCEGDLIQPSIFDRLESRLSRLNEVAEHATIHFAHPATQISREGRELEGWGMEDARAALQLLTETAEFVGRWFVNSGVGDVLPTPQYDQFAYLDKPMASAATVSDLRQQWDDFASETVRWPMIEDRAL